MRLKTLLRTSAAVATTAAVGGAASSTGARSAWYAALDKPAFQPPPAAFPVVWTGLYVALAGASATTIDGLDDRAGEREGFRRALAANLVLNGAWTWVFFRGHRLPAATVVAGALAASSADLARRAAAVSRPAGRALVPYAAWCGFATVLSAALWRRNR